MESSAELIAKGLAALRNGQLATADRYMTRAAVLTPHDSTLLSYRGVVQQQLGNAAPARALFEQAIALNPNNADAMVNLGLLLQEGGDHQGSRELYSRALTIAPNHAVAHANLGSLLQEAGQLDEALTHYHAALRGNPNFATPYNNVGLIALERGNYDAALAALQNATRLDPLFADAWCNLGNAYKSTGRFHDAITAYDKAIASRQDYAGAHWNKALLLLLLGDWRTGLAEYEWGFAAKERHERRFPYPKYLAGSLHNKRILVYAEQGVGDEIFFARFLPPLLERGAGVVVDCDPRLQHILQRSFPAVTFHGGGKHDSVIWAKQYEPFDYVLAQGTIPNALQIALPSFPAAASYLAPDTSKVAHWRARLASCNALPKIGIAWRGGKDPQLQRERSIALLDWQSILRTSSVCFVNLQYGDHAAEIAAVSRQLGIDILTFPELDPLRDLDDFSAAVAALDLVISTDNSTVHFSGAIGQTTWTLLPFVPEWRWQLNSESTPWYASMRLFRQTTLGDWRPVVAKVSRELQHWLIQHDEKT